MIESLGKIFDPYSRVARLYPALITLSPIAWTAASLSPQPLTQEIAKMLVAIVIFFGGMTLLANVARSRGKVLEEQLIKDWGGWRTTVMLRHGDASIDPHTKARYHKQLGKLCPGLKLPIPESEKSNPIDADNKYRSATIRLIELRRDPKYKLLHRENANYGFRRNLLGLKPIALAVVGLSLVTTLISAALAYHHEPALRGLMAEIGERPSACLAIVADIAYAGFMLVLVRRHFVRQSANEYSFALLRTLDED